METGESKYATCKKAKEKIQMLQLAIYSVTLLLPPANMQIWKLVNANMHLAKKGKGENTDVAIGHLQCDLAFAICCDAFAATLFLIIIVNIANCKLQKLIKDAKHM